MLINQAIRTIIFLTIGYNYKNFLQILCKNTVIYLKTAFYLIFICNNSYEILLLLSIFNIKNNCT